MSPTLTPQAFAAKWRGDTRKERSVSQEHFIDLCRLLGHETPGESRDGNLAFEEGASKQRGGQGWVDVWKHDFFAWEYKGPHDISDEEILARLLALNLERAERQPQERQA